MNNNTSTWQVTIKETIGKAEIYHNSLVRGTYEQAQEYATGLWRIYYGDEETEIYQDEAWDEEMSRCAKVDGIRPIEFVSVYDLTSDQELRIPIKPAKCDDCGLPYEDFPIDVVFPNDEWELLSGNREGGGLLCAKCIANRAGKLDGVVAIKATLEKVPTLITRWDLEDAGWIRQFVGYVRYWKYPFLADKRQRTGFNILVGFGDDFFPELPFMVYLVTDNRHTSLPSITTMPQLNAFIQLLAYKEED